jgi:hypothetical protein
MNTGGIFSKSEKRFADKKKAISRALQPHAFLLRIALITCLRNATVHRFHHYHRCGCGWRCFAQIGLFHIQQGIRIDDFAGIKIMQFNEFRAINREFEIKILLFSVKNDTRRISGRSSGVSTLSITCLFSTSIFG